jgi:hypothetical protein
VKLAEFNAICEREWREAHGDVMGLNLTDDSRQELVNDVLTSDTFDSCLLLIEESDLPAIRAGAGIGSVTNPITRTVVKITGGASVDSAEVRRYYAKALEVTGEAEVPRGRLAAEMRVR